MRIDWRKLTETREEIRAKENRRDEIEKPPPLDRMSRRGRRFRALFSLQVAAPPAAATWSAREWQ